MSDDDEKTALKILAIPTVFIGFLIILLPFGIYNAWVLQKLYIWFLLPLGLPALNLWHVWGIYILIAQLSPSSQSNDKNYMKKLPASLFGTLIGGLLALALGFILKGHI